jgi:putative transposase
MPSACTGCTAKWACNYGHKTLKRRVKAKLREDRRPATGSNETWAMDFVHDQLTTGTKPRVLTIVDTFSRFSPAIEPRFNFRGADVGRGGGARKSRASVWIAGSHPPRRPGLGVCVARFGSVGVPPRRHTRLLPAGKPTYNAFIESVNGKFGAECLNARGS